MRLLTRYVTAELLKVFLVTLVALTSLLLILGVLAEANKKGLGPGQVARIVPYVLPDVLRYTIPATILFAASSVYGRMSGTNEIVAAKALGINPLSLISPALVLAFLLSLASVWLNDVAVSWGQNGVQRVVIEGVEEIVYSMLKTQRSFSSRQFSVIVEDIDEKRLIHPTFTFNTPDNATITVIAREASLDSDPANNVLGVTCQDATVEGGELSGGLDTFRYELPLDKATPSADMSYLPARMAMRVIPREIRKTVADIERYRDECALTSATSLLTGDFDSLAGTNWKRYDEDLRERTNHLHRLKTEPPRRWASGFSCFSFVLVGTAVAIRFRNAEFLTTFFIVFLPILLGYYPLLVASLEQAKNGVVPPFSVWLGNVVAILFGAWQTRIVTRY